MEAESHTDYICRLKIVKITKFVMLSIQFLTSFAKIYVEFVEPDPFNIKDIDFSNSDVL
jgi:hypothetical protein